MTLLIEILAVVGAVNLGLAFIWFNVFLMVKLLP